MKKETLDEILNYVSDFKNDLVGYNEEYKISELVSAEDFKNTMDHMDMFKFLESDLDDNQVYIVVEHEKLKHELIYRYNAITLSNPCIYFGE